MLSICGSPLLLDAKIGMGVVRIQQREREQLRPQCLKCCPDGFTFMPQPLHEFGGVLCGELVRDLRLGPDEPLEALVEKDVQKALSNRPGAGSAPVEKTDGDALGLSL